MKSILYVAGGVVLGAAILVNKGLTSWEEIKASFTGGLSANAGGGASGGSGGTGTTGQTGGTTGQGGQGGQTGQTGTEQPPRDKGCDNPPCEGLQTGAINGYKYSL